MNQEFLQKAEQLKPQIYKTIVTAEGDYGPLAKREKKVFDLGNHYVGYCHIELSTVGGVVDAPTFLSVTFAETKEDLDTDIFHVESTISSGWIQKEYIHVDFFPQTISFPRRYACRYIQVECIGVSTNYVPKIDKVIFEEETSACGSVPSIVATKEVERIDQMAVRTLRSCMQDVFEDGPKRDRRLWLGDLRLQALTNYVTYQNYDLVKRCLYLFAATCDENGRMKGCVFTNPKVYVEPMSVMYDYPLLFIPTLLEYFEASKDRETLEELYPVAIRQLQIASEIFDCNDRVDETKNMGWCFIDWNQKLDKVPCAVAVYIYSARYAMELCKLLEKPYEWIQKEVEQKSRMALQNYYDEKQGLFIGKEGQISYACNVWFCLARVLPLAENKQILRNLRACESALKPVTPYMYHYYLQALIDCGDENMAYSLLKWYWGGMAALGADTFFEVFNPENLDESPYGNKALLSYCHAWSTTPAYFLRRYSFRDNKK